MNEEECRSIGIIPLGGDGVTLRVVCLLPRGHVGLHGFAQYDLDRSRDPLLFFTWPQVMEADRALERLVSREP